MSLDSGKDGAATDSGCEDHRTRPEPIAFRSRFLRMIGRGVREPLVHFAITGGAIFVFWQARGPKTVPEKHRIVVTSGEISRAITLFSATHLRLPTSIEVQGLIEEAVRDQVYYREALALGLDRDDEIIRRRLEQKLRFITDDASERDVPTDAELQRFLEQHADEFRAEPRILLRQIYLDPSRHGDVEADARSLLERLRRDPAGVAGANPGDPLPVPSDCPEMTVAELARTFGQSFADGLAGEAPDTWFGPVRSGYGIHLVCILRRVPGAPRALSEARDAVLREWRHEHRVAASEKAYQRMRANYDVVVDAAPPNSRMISADPPRSASR